MKRCRVCNRWIWFWQQYRFQVVKIVETGEIVEHNHQHIKCKEHYLSPRERDLMR